MTAFTPTPDALIPELTPRQELALLAPELKAVFPAHNTPGADPALLVKLQDKLDRVLTGKVDPIPVSDGNVEFRFEDFSFLMRADYNRLPVE